MCDNFIAVFSTLGLVLTIIKYELDISYFYAHKELWEHEFYNDKATNSVRFKEWEPNKWRFIVLGLSVASVICVYFR